MRGQLRGLFAVVAVACVSQRTALVRPVPTAFGPGLSLETAPSAFVPEGPLRVLHVSPQGPEQKPREVAIVFDRPIRALGVDDSGPVGFTIQPPIEGRWAWIGTHAVVFDPSAHEFPGATEFSVRVPDEVAGIDGSRLQQSVGFQFATERPKASLRGCGRDYVEPRSTFRVEFSLPTDPAEVERAVRVECRPYRSGYPWASWPVRFVPRKQQPDRVYRVVPQTPWPTDSTIRVRVDSSLTSRAGPLSAADTVETHCWTYPPPYAEVSCYGNAQDSCPPNLDVTIRFDNPPLDTAPLRAIRVEPRAAVAVDESGSVTLTGLSALTDYRVTIPAGLRGKHGGITEEPQILEFRTSEQRYPAWTGLGASNGRLEPSLLGPIGFSVSNTPEYFFAVRPVTARELLSLSTERAEQLHAAYDLLLQDHWTHTRLASAAPNHHRATVDIKPWLDPSSGTGAVLMDISPTPRRRSEDESEQELRAFPTVLSVSDLALTTKLWLDGGLVWVTSLREQRPLAGVRVSLLEGDAVTLVGVTGPDGVVTFPPSVLKKYWIVDSTSRWERSIRSRSGVALLAQSGKDWTLQQLRSGGDTITWAVPSVESRQPRLSLFLDRGVYRPGEPLYVKGYAEQQTSGKSHPIVRRPVKVTLVSYVGWLTHEHASRQLTTNDYGAFSTRFLVPLDASTAEFYVSASLGEQGASVPLAVSAIRPREFEAAVSDPKPGVARDSTQFLVSGKYLFGEPMRGARVKWRISHKGAEYAPPNSEGYDTSAWRLAGHPPYEQQRPAPILGEGRLSDDGELRVEARLEQDLLFPHRMTLTADVFDVARQVVQKAGSVLVHPARHYVGIRTNGSAVVHRPFAVEGVALGWDGARIGGRTIDVALLKEQEPTRTPDDSDDEAPSEDGPLSRVGGCRIRSAAEVRRCWLVAREPGDYVVLAESRDDTGRLARATTSLNVDAKRTRTREPYVHHELSYEPLSVDLELDREAYHVGDEARLRVDSPYERALAIVSLERDGVYWHETREVERSSTFRIPVLESMGNHATVDVLLLRRPGRSSVYRSREVPDEVTSAHGSVPVRLADDQWRLSVEVTPSVAEAAPGDTFRCDFQLRDRLGRPKPGELAVWAVDEGVLQLTDYRIPDPLEDFTRDKPHETSTLDSRRSLSWLDPLDGQGMAIGLGSIGTLGHGSGTGTRPMPARKRGPATVLFEPHVLTDAQGRAALAIRLPQQLSRFRVMSVATTQRGEFGSGQAVVTVRIPLAARPMMPRFLRVGDEFDAGVVVSADADVKATASITVTASGITRVSPNHQQALLEGGRAQDIAFRWRADKVGTARFRFDVATGDHADAVTLALPVLQRTPSATLALYGEARDVRGERIARLPRMVGNRGTLALSLGNTPLVGLSTAVEALLGYEHECTEQVASRLLVLGPLRAFAEQQGAKFPSDRERQIQRLIERIHERQHSNGGFGFWSRESPSVWLTAYVTWVLHRTGTAGIADTSSLLESALSYLRNPRKEVEPYEQAFVADVLMEVAPAQQDRNVVDGLVASKGSLPPFAEACLLHTLSLAPRPRKSWRATATELARHLSGALTLAGDRAYVRPRTGDFWSVLDSSDRTQALVLRGLLAHDPHHPLAAALLKGLLASRRGETWSSTQATAWALSTIAEAQAVHRWGESESEELVWLGGQRIARLRLDAKRREQSVQHPWAARSTSTDLIFEHCGPGSLFYAARLSFEPAQSAMGPSSHGFEITHGIAPIADTGALPQPAPLGSAIWLEAGQAVLGEIQLFSPGPRHQVVVEAPLPAGLEPIDPRLSDDPFRPVEDDRTSRFARLSHGDYEFVIHDDHINFYIEQLEPGIARLTYKARATTKGNFLLPPARVQEMYYPEHEASTIATRVTVGDRADGLPPSSTSEPDG
ncbi:MAG: hypothetical protein JW940_34320 [Polyangiaceae bacterium]|nr:hypothetical protein [Polyangiaceae bacterium]